MKLFKSHYGYRVVGAMEDKIKREQRRLKTKQKHLKKKKPSRKQVVRAIKLSHQLDANYFNMFK